MYFGTDIKITVCIFCVSIFFSDKFYYYFCDESSDENDYSVCTLFEYKANGESKYFFLGGDLEKKGENKMVEFYDGSTEEKTMPKVELYKAGHHGSNTSSNTAFLEMLKPSVCVVSCCCGTNEYTTDYTIQFPTQQFINRIALWTDAVYATSVWDVALNSFKDLKAVIITHGEPKTKEIFAEKVYNEIETKSVGIINRDYLFRISSYGVEKTMPTKFLM